MPQLVSVGRLMGGARNGALATLTAVAAVADASSLTTTGTTSGDISAGVFGTEFSVNTVPNPPTVPYQFSQNTPGAASSQSNTIVYADYGIVSGDTIYLRDYYNLDPLDDVSTRIYGTPTLIVIVSFPIGLEGSAFFLLMETGSNILVEAGASADISAFAAASALGGTETVPGVQSAATTKITLNQIQTFVNA